MVVSGKNFQEMAEGFILFCLAKGLAKRTIGCYDFALNGLGRFLATQNGNSELSKNSLRKYITHLLERGLARHTISIRLRSIRVFCNWLKSEGFVDISPFDGVDIPRLPKSLPRSLTKSQVKSIMKVCNSSSWTGIRNYAMILTFFDTGIRLSELIQLNLSDLNLGEWSLKIRHGKGDKERHVFMGRKLHRIMRMWINARGITVAQDALFISSNGERIDKRNVQRILRRLADKAGLKDVKVSPHRLRHTFAVEYIRNGGDPFSLQRILGHSSISTTTIYVHLAGAGLREAHAKASPVDRL